MDSSVAEQRISERIPVCLSGTVICQGSEYLERPALVRDISDDGVFFYSKTTPSVGSAVTVHFTLPGEASSTFCVCQGSVVRVVEFPNGAATGIAAKLAFKERMVRDS